jgi:hypothetical protein
LRANSTSLLGSSWVFFLKACSDVNRIALLDEVKDSNLAASVLETQHMKGNATHEGPGECSPSSGSKASKDFDQKRASSLHQKSLP